MDNISALIKEAKPLYFARKRRNNLIKSFAAMLVCTVMAGSLFFQSDNPAWDYGYYFYDGEFSVSDSRSIIEDMGLPVDDYGLLMIG